MLCEMNVSSQDMSTQWLKYFRWYLVVFFPNLLIQYQWNYKHDLCVMGADRLYQATGEGAFRQAVLAAAPWLVDLQGNLCAWTPAEFNADKISFGKSLSVLFRYTGDLTYQELMHQVYTSLARYPRTSKGGFWHKDIYPHQVWLDGLYMILPFYAERAGANLNRIYSDIIDQFRAAKQVLFDARSNLYLHAYDESRREAWADPVTGRSPCVWMRAVGWHLMALADCYEVMKRSGFDCESLAQLLLEALDGLWPYLDVDSGMFLQLVDRADLPGNYPETSGSAMVAYACLKGSRLGMLSPHYAVRGHVMLEAIKRNNLREVCGQLHLYGICASAGLGAGPDHRTDRDGSAAYYLSEPQMTDNQHGAAACMMAVAEDLLSDGK